MSITAVQTAGPRSRRLSPAPVDRRFAESVSIGSRPFDAAAPSRPVADDGPRSPSRTVDGEADDDPQPPRFAATAQTARVGTAESFVQRMYAEHGSFLRAFVLRLTAGDRFLAEDVVQETMVRAWRHADRLLAGGPRCMLPWLTTVARRIVINERRARNCRPTEVSDVLLDVVPVQDETDRALQRRIILDALGKLSMAHRTVIVEIYLRGRTVEDLARILGVPPGTVKSRTYYAMRALRGALLRQGVTR